MLQLLLTFLTSPAGQTALAAGEGLFERGLTAIEAFIALEKAKTPSPSNVLPFPSVSGSTNQ